MRDLSGLREEYWSRGFPRSGLTDDPLTLFGVWFEEWAAVEPYDPNAMLLATADDEGRPSARWVLLKGVDSRGFAFFTNLESRKGTDLAVNPRAALCFGWLEMGRQIRVEGPVEQIDGVEADTYFAGRPRGSQLSAWASPQSQVIADRQTLVEWVAEIEERYPGDVPRPPNWGGYRMVPEEIEFWQGRFNRLHDRYRYRRDPDRPTGWRIDRLSP